MKIKIPPFAQSHFWEEPRNGNMEFWAFKEKPNCSIGEKIEFYFGTKLVAEARVARVESPRLSECLTTGKFKEKWKVHWFNNSFKDLR